MGHWASDPNALEAFLLMLILSGAFLNNSLRDVLISHSNSNAVFTVITQFNLVGA